MDNFRHDGKALNTSHLYAFMGHLIYFSSIYYLYNPFLESESTIRFSVFVGMLVVGSVMIRISGRKIQTRTAAISILSIIVFSIATFRMNFVSSEVGTSYRDIIFQSIIASAALWSSILITDSFKPKIALKVIYFVTGICSIWICLNYADLFDYEQRQSYRLGNLGYDSYQIAAQILGIYIISAISLVRSGKFLSIGAILSSLLSIICLFVMLQGYARGEALALVVSVLLLIFGRTLFVGIAVIIASFSNIILSTFDLPLFNRLFSILQGDVGDRDILFRQALDIFHLEPSVIIFGKGMNYFQFFYALPLERYPHNVFIESMISGGFLMALIMIYVFIYPIVKSYFKGGLSRERGFLFAICVYNSIIYMKSGTITSFWGLAIFACFYLRLSEDDSGGDGVLKSAGGRARRIAKA